MRHQGKVLTAVAEASAAVLCIAGCRDTTAPRDQVLVRIEVTSSVVAPNHSVNLLGIVYNPTADTVFAGAGCAPGVGFWATDPAGQVTSLYAGSVWLCDQKDSNVIAPGETDSVGYFWRAPLVTGVYQLRAGLFYGGGPQSPSEPALVAVR